MHGNVNVKFIIISMFVVIILRKLQERYCQYILRAGSHLGSNWLRISALVSWCCTTGWPQTRSCIRIRGHYSSNSLSHFSILH